MVQNMEYFWCYGINQLRCDGTPTLRMYIINQTRFWFIWTEYIIVNGLVSFNMYFERGEGQIK